VVWPLSWPYNGSVLPCSKVVFAVSFIHIFPTYSGIGATFFFKTGPKKAILRTNAHECARGNTKKRQETLFYPHITGVFASFLPFALLPSIYTPAEGAFQDVSSPPFWGYRIPGHCYIVASVI
jgi:hypothetical protein